MKDELEKIENEFREFLINAKLQVEKGNKAAGARSRKTSLRMDKLFKNWRAVSVRNNHD